MSYLVKAIKLAAIKQGEEWKEKPVKPVVDCSGDEIITVQSDERDADINKIMARAEKTGMLPLKQNGQPFYGDVSEFGGLQEAIMMAQEADELFMGMPASLRERFDNDPVKFVNFFEDPNNLEEAYKLGIAVRPPVQPAAPAPSPAPAGGGTTPPAQ